MNAALKLATFKFDVMPMFGRGRMFAPVFGQKRDKRVVTGKRRVKVASCDGTRETGRELAVRLNWLRNRIAEAS